LLQFSALIKALKELLVFGQWIEVSAKLHYFRGRTNARMVKILVMDVHHLWGITRLVERVEVQSLLRLDDTGQVNQSRQVEFVIQPESARNESLLHLPVAPFVWIQQLQVQIVHRSFVAYGQIQTFRDLFIGPKDEPLIQFLVAEHVVRVDLLRIHL
jgi:hypothetical protein